MRVIGGFVRARARAGLAPLVALTVVAALAAGLAAAVVGAVRAVEAAVVVSAVEDSSGDRDRVVVRFDGADPAAGGMPEAVAGALSGLGAAGALRTASDPADGILEYTVDPSRFTADAAIALVAGLPDLADGIEERIALDVQVSGGLRSTLLGVREGLEARRGPIVVGLAVYALLAAVVVATVALEPVRARSGETRLLRARGARARTLLGLTAGETVLCAGAGAAAGAVVGTVAVSAATGVILGPWIGVASAAGVAVVALGSALIATARGLGRASTRADATAGIGAAVLAAALTGVALWQFSTVGTPVVERSGGAAALDPVVALAPALTLALAALLAVLIVTPLAGAVARLSERSRGLSPVLPLRLVSRRPGRHALTTAVVAFAVGAITLAASYQGTVAAVGDAPEALRVGADVRVTSAPEDAGPATVAGFAGVDATMGVHAADARGADGRIPVLAADAPDLGDVMLDAGGAIDPAALAAALQIPETGVIVPEGADAIGIRLVVAEPPPFVDHDGQVWEPGTPFVVASVVLTDPTGATAELHASNAEITASSSDETGEFVDRTTFADRTEVLDVPEGGPWRVSLVGVVNPDWGLETDATIELSTSAGPLDISAYRLRGDGAMLDPAGTGLRFDLPAPEASDPDVPYAAPGDAPAAAPAAVTADLAASLALEVGDATSLQVPDVGGPLDLEVAAIIPVLPGSASGEGVLVDRTAASLVVGQPLTATEVWVSTDDPALVIDEVSARLPGARTDAADHRSADAAADTAWAFVLAAAGAALLALVVLLLRRTRSRADAREFALLALLGAGRAGARRMRTSEDLFALATGVVGGLAAGAATAWLVVPALVRAAYVSVPDGFPIALQAEPVTLIAAVAVTVSVFALVVGSVRAPSELSPLVREDE